jgi:hypothetical protein
MSIHYENESVDSSDKNDPKGHFAAPNAVDPNQFTCHYYAGSPGPEYWICLVKVKQIINSTTLKIEVFRTNGKLGPNAVDVSLNDITQVWRRTPSTVDQEVPGQGPLTAGQCLVLCITDKVVSAAGIDSGQELFGKHPWGGDATLLEAFREMAKRLAHDIGSGTLPKTQAAKAKYPDLFL